MLDAASLPGLTQDEQKELLHIRVVGGGAVGIEATAEIYDLWNNDMRILYPHLEGEIRTRRAGPSLTRPLFVSRFGTN